MHVVEPRAKARDLAANAIEIGIARRLREGGREKEWEKERRRKCDAAAPLTWRSATLSPLRGARVLASSFSPLAVRR
jgi:hypothetical protein